MADVKVDMSRLSFAEAWRWGGTANVLALLGMKLVGEPRFLPSTVPAPSGIQRVDPAMVDGPVRSELLAVLEELEPLEFRQVLWYGETSAPTAVAVLHGTGCALGLVVHARSAKGSQTVFSTFSRLTDGKFLGASNSRVGFDPPPEYRMRHLPGSSAGETAKAHLAQLSTVRVEALGSDDVEPMITESQRRLHDNLVRRGIYVPT